MLKCEALGFSLRELCLPTKVTECVLVTYIKVRSLYNPLSSRLFSLLCNSECHSLIIFHLKKVKSVFSVIMLVLEEKANGSIQLTLAAIICDPFFPQLSHSNLFHLSSSGSPPMPLIIFTSYFSSYFNFILICCLS